MINGYCRSLTLKLHRKSNLKRILSFGVSAILLIASLSGCSAKKETGTYKSDERGAGLSSKVIASNSNYELKWDGDAQCVLLSSLTTGKTWSNILYDDYLTGSTSANGNSSLVITVSNSTTMKWDTVRSYAEMMEKGHISCQKIDNGIRVIYYFDLYEISVPVDYQLRDDSVLVSIRPSEIQESAKSYQLVSVSVAPFICSVKNTSSDAYLFVPSGSGALMYSAENADGTRTYSAEVYGDDASRKIAEDFTDGESVRLPVFGAKEGNTAVLGIIEENAGAARIEAQSGNARLGYSYVYSTFYVRGYDSFRYGSYALANNVITRVSSDITSDTMAVGFYPLYDDSADYNGMAKRYRTYLQETKALENNDVLASPYSITIHGGTLERSALLGIPHDKLTAMTTFAAAESMISGLIDKNQITPTVRMMDYGDKGIVPGTIAGGKSFASVYGNQKNIRSLTEYCKQNSTQLYMDFDVVRYSKSGLGFSYGKDCAKTAILYQATQYPITPLRLFDQTMPYRILSRGRLSDAIKVALKKAKKYNISGVSFSTLGSLAYSDFSDKQYYVKSKTENDIIQLLKQASSDEKTVAVSAANSYAAAAADVLFDIPVETGDYDFLDEAIPFYSMVFHGSKAMYSCTVNLGENAERRLMLAAVNGIGLGFDLIDYYNTESKDLTTEKLYGMLYDDNVGLIGNYLQRYSDYFNSISGATIDLYEILENGVTKTVFDNGVVLYANHTAEKVTYPVGMLNAYEFKTEQEDG